MATESDVVRLRELDPARDYAEVRGCFVALQDFERSLDLRIPEGERVADRYLDLMFERCRRFDGLVLVAEESGVVIGYVTVWRRFRSDEPDDDPSEHAFISDLVVLPAHRGRGVGRRLLRSAAASARDAGVRWLRLSVKAGNRAALALYNSEGFRESEVFLEKRL